MRHLLLRFDADEAIPWWSNSILPLHSPSFICSRLSLARITTVLPLDLSSTTTSPFSRVRSQRLACIIPSRRRSPDDNHFSTLVASHSRFTPIRRDLQRSPSSAAAAGHAPLFLQPSHFLKCCCEEFVGSHAFRRRTAKARVWELTISISGPTRSKYRNPCKESRFTTKQGQARSRQWHKWNIHFHIMIPESSRWCIPAF